MRVERDAGGDYVLGSDEIATRFRWSVTQLRRSMKQGLVSSSVETGMGEDAGTSRLTLRCGNRVWRAVLDARGHIISEEICVERVRRRW
jgi:hypothetical protein